MVILGIETSCDETALALIETRGVGADMECRVIGSLIHSQAELHSAYGGVFPTLAKREHGKNIVPLLGKLLGSANLPTAGTASLTGLETFKNELETQNPDLWASLTDAHFLEQIPAIDRIAVTEGPGLEPALWVGINFAKVLSAIWNIPIVPINHMEGHIVGSLLPSDTSNGSWQKLHGLALPSLALLISGGHTELIKISKIGDYEIIGQTKDDAVGEAFDKAARLLGLPYPGGPHLSKLSHEAWQGGIQAPVALPRPMMHSKDLDFSFSGLKTAVLYAVRDQKELTDGFKKGLAREFEQAVSETLEAKLRKAIDKIGAKSVIIGGGVSANHMLRKRFTAIAEEYGIPLFMPSQHISGDNALMIALAAAFHSADADRMPKAHGTKRLGA